MLRLLHCHCAGTHLKPCSMQCGLKSVAVAARVLFMQHMPSSAPLLHPHTSPLYQTNIMLLQLALNQTRATPALLLHAARGLLPSVGAAAYTNSAAASSAAPEALDASSSSTSSSLAVSMHGPTAVVELNRPKQMNALSTQVMHEFVDTVMALDAQPSVRSIIVTGRGKAFAAGADIREMAQLTHYDAEQQQLFARWQQVSTGRRHWTPLIAAVNGVALGGGCELAMLCDVVIASTEASFGLPEVTLGVIPGIGGTQRLTRLVGRARAVDAMLTANRLSAAEALSAGLVSRVVAAEQLLPEALKIGDKLASLPAGAVAKVLQAAQAAETLPLDAGLELERKLFYSCFGTHDQREGMGAFLEKRKPVFQPGKEAVA